MLKSCVCAVLLLGATSALSVSAFAAPAAPQSPPGVSNITPVQGWGERCHWLRERLHEVEGRLYSAPPWERPRIEHRLWELRREFRETCRRGY
jgi:hypothetical protein